MTTDPSLHRSWFNQRTRDEKLTHLTTKHNLTLASDASHDTMTACHRVTHEPTSKAINPRKKKKKGVS